MELDHGLQVMIHVYDASCATTIRLDEICISILFSSKTAEKLGPRFHFPAHGDNSAFHGVNMDYGIYLGVACCENCSSSVLQMQQLLLDRALAPPHLLLCPCS